MNDNMINVTPDGALVPFCRRHFEMHFLDRKFLYFVKNVHEIRFLGFNQQEAIVWADEGLVYLYIYALLGFYI